MLLDHILSANNRSRTRKYLTFGLSFSDCFSLKKNEKLNSVHYIRHIVRVPVLYVCMFFLDFVFIFYIALFDLSGNTFGQFWSLPRPSKSGPYLQK